MNDARMKFLALILGFSLWAALGYLGKVPLDPLIALLQMGLGGLITHMLQGGSQTSALAPYSPAAPGGQGGYAGLPFLALLVPIALGAALLTGCASFSQGYSAVQASTESNAKLATKNYITTWRDMACATPLFAAFQNPDVIPGLKALCLPGGAASNASDLLTGTQPITVQLMMPSAAASSPAGSK